VADNVTGVIPQVILSAPALAVTGVFTVIVNPSCAEVQGPFPSGSGTFQVNVTVVPVSDADGV
jgi:hypothetical protein